MSLRHKLSVADDVIREYGWRSFLVRTVPWLFHKHFYVYAGRILGSDEQRSLETSFRLESASARDIDRVVGMQPSFYSRRLVTERFKGGHICFLGWLGRTPVHIRWLFTGPVYLPYLGRSVVLGPGEAYSDESFTLREFRHLGLTGLAMSLLGRRMAELNFQRFIAMVASWNTATRRLMKTQGLECIGECGYRIGLLTGSFFARGAVVEGKGRTIRFPSG